MRMKKFIFLPSNQDQTEVDNSLYQPTALSIYWQLAIYCTSLVVHILHIKTS